MNKLPLELTKLLYARFCTIYADKFVKSHSTPEFIQIWWEEWSEGMAGIDPAHIKEGLSYCRMNLEWPPSIAEFRCICEQSSGMPSISESFACAIRKDFNHPIIALTYEKVGSWAMKNDKEAVLSSKFKSAYEESLHEFRQYPNESWLKLNQFNEKLTLPLPPSKIPSHAEITGFKQRFIEYQEIAKEDKTNPAYSHPEWLKENITRGNKKFNEAIFNERKRYLIALDEKTAGTLSRNDKYDRIRYLREIEGQQAIKNNTIGDGLGKIEKMPPRACNVVRMPFNKWSD